MQRKEWMVRNAHVRMTFIHNGDGWKGLLEEFRSGGRWGPVPLVELEVADRMQERTDIVRNLQTLLLEGDETHVHLVLRDPLHGVTLGLWVTALATGEVSLIVPPAEVEEADRELYQLWSVEILPGLVRVGPEGHLFLPLRTGMIGSPSGKQTMRDRFLIYGEQERWELLPTLPICGGKTPTGGLLLLAVQGACDMYCAATTDGQGHGTVNLYPMLRRHWEDPVDWTERELRLIPLTAQEDLVVAAARRVRRHLLDDFHVPTLRERAEASPICAYQQRAYTMKMFHGIQRQGLMMMGREAAPREPLYLRTLTFAEAEERLRRLRAAGLDRIYLQSVGWNPKGHDGAWPTDLPVDRRLGGEAGLRALIGTAKALGYHIMPHLNLVDACFDSPDFHADWVITDLTGKPKVTGYWGGGRTARHWGLAVPDSFLRRRLEHVKALGFTGMAYLDGMGNPLYVNYHPIYRGPRRDYAAGLHRFLDLAREMFGAVQTELGYLYVVPHTDALCTPSYLPWHAPPFRRPWPVSVLAEEPVPAWSLATHDLVTLEQQGIGWKDVMNAILFGKVMRDEWAAHAGVMPGLDERRIVRLKAIYDLVTVRWGHLVPQEIVAWNRLKEGVERTRFADGTEVLADFAEERLSVNGETVPRPPEL